MTNVTKSLDFNLTEICKSVSINNANCKKKQAVFKEIFDQVKSKMLKQCNYFKKYSSYNIAVGSNYDGTKIKFDEFDMNIVIQLPISYEDGDEGIIIENEEPGFVKMKIKKAFDNLKSDIDWEKYHKVTSSWKDEENYFLQSAIRAWLHSIVERAVKHLRGGVEVNGVIYSVRCNISDSGHTLHVQNRYGNIDLTLDVNLVPVINFQLPRWPDGYRRVSIESRAHWFVVAKPYNDIEDETLKNRLWRLSFQEFEKKMMDNCQNLKITIMLMKMLRDNMELDYIATYYIKTLFLWKIHKVKDRKYWNESTNKLFREMVGELRDAIAKRNLPYFWKEELNLISGIDETILEGYEKILTDFTNNMDANNIVTVFAYLLSHKEFIKFYDNLGVTSGSFTRPLSNQHHFLDSKNPQNKASNHLAIPVLEETNYFPGYLEELTNIVKKIETGRSDLELYHDNETKPSTSKETNPQINTSNRNSYTDYTRVKRKFHEI